MAALARRRIFRHIAWGMCISTFVLALADAGPTQPAQTPKFKTGVEIVTITATVTDADGRLVTDLAKDEFEVFEDGQLQTITQFTGERVPVSLAALLDISDSMVGERLKDARRALDSFFFELMTHDDEFALVLFNHEPTIATRWTTAPEVLRPALDAMRGWGGTAIYDAFDASLPLFETRHRQRAAGVMISDGADTASDIDLRVLRSKLLRTDAFFYAIAIDRDDPRALSRRVNPYALREVTDDTGGYTEVVKGTSELGPATARIANELNHQYTMAFSMTHPPDDKFHSLRVRVRRPQHRVRARRGYIATTDRKTF